MLKPLLLLSIAATGAMTAPDAVVIRFAGDSSTVAGMVVDGKDYAPVDVLAEKLGAKVVVDASDAAHRTVLVTPGAVTPKGFDDAPETPIALGATGIWQTVPGSRGRIRVRDFIKTGDGWKQVGEVEVAPETLLVDGRVPRDKMTLQFYVTGLDKDGKTVLRDLVYVPNVSYGGGRFPITVNGYYGAATLPANFTIRYNGADEGDRGAAPQGGN